MAFSAAQAKKNSADWLATAQKENQEYNRQRIAREKREANAIWETRGVKLVEEIDAHIKIQSANGQHHTYMPSSINPDGSRDLAPGRKSKNPRTVDGPLSRPRVRSHGILSVRTED